MDGTAMDWAVALGVAAGLLGGTWALMLLGLRALGLA